MITKDQATNPDNRVFYNGTWRNKDGAPMRARRNGMTKTWKTRPQEWVLPVKQGMYSAFHIHEGTAHDWFLSEAEAIAHRELHHGL